MSTYRIGDIRPNPFRNIDRYPINREKVAKLKESIGRTDFWDNLVARVNADGKPEIGYGHHRMVALRELYPDDHEVNLIIRDLDDAAMLHVMADENMQEWAASGAVIVETVRAVRDFLLAGKAKVSNGGRPPETASTSAITAFLGWPESRVQDALSIILAEEAGDLTPADTAGLSIEQATTMRRHVTRIAEPAVRAKAIARVREDLREERIGKRGIGDVVREVRQEAAPTKPRVPEQVARQMYSDVEHFFDATVEAGLGRATRTTILTMIAENRDAEELTRSVRPWADQIADALDALADQARDHSARLRSGREARPLLPEAVTA